MHSATTPFPIRYPKSRFAMRSVYSFTAASVLTSIIFSLLLFISIDDDPLMQGVFGCLAIIFELGKFFVWYEVGERLARRHYIAAITALVFYAVLAAISIAGSVGGINSATNKAQSYANVQQNQITAFNRQIEAIDQQIALNNEAAKKYIELNRIATGLKRIQNENNGLRRQQQALAMERDSLPVTRQGSVLGLIDGLAQTLQISSKAAQLGLVILLSILLDFFAAFFISLIGDELRFRKHFERLNAAQDNIEETPPKLLTYQEETSEKETKSNQATDGVNEEVNVNEEISLYQQVLNALQAREVLCSKKSVVATFKIDQEQAEAIFQQLLLEGRVSQKANNHYRWEGDDTQ